MPARTRPVRVADGEFDLHLWFPERGHGPGLLLIPEIFGVSDYIRAVAADLASLGYVVAVPDLFWRLERNWASGHDDEGVARSLELGSRYDVEAGADDCAAAFETLSSLPEVMGGAGILGFCLGGSLAYVLAARAEPAVLLSFYGTAVPEKLGLLDEIHCPVQFHFGGQDTYIPRDKVAAVEEAVAGRPGVEIHVQEAAGHAFHNFRAPRFHHPEAGRTAWRLAMDFLARRLPAS
ncbi:dienelactone hydrolase family protein [Microbispora sp. NPDC049125]|uniref:dienelactone hydrolase family protein n=1 Tax=Microbispora sp. NPDC049125 TaxID=3154929 RepID=UPI003467EB27